MSSINDKYSIAGRYRTVRKHLDTLGYKQALSLDSLPLIELLLVDLAETREAMKHYQAIAQNKIVACSEVYPEIDPYTCNNSKLVQECNQLHLELIEAKEENQKLSNDLKKKIRRLESELNDLQASFVKNLQRIKQLETESAEKSKKILELTGKCCKPSVSNANLADRKRSAYPLRRPVLHADPLPPSPKKSINSSCITFTSNKVEPYMVDFVSMADRRINDMTKQVSDLKEELHDNSEIIESLKSKLSCKEKEISRLRKVLEEGRLYTSDNKNDHCYSESEKSSRYNKEQLLSEKMNLEHQLKESLEKQHEAMTKALNMAKRNEELENQLRCADRMALNAEADCNLTVKENNKRVCKLQKKLEDLMTQVHTLKSELTIQSREAQELRADLEACRLEKTNVQRILENTLEEKKQMTDKFNQLTMTADRLSSGSRCYKEVNENNMPGECMCRKETEDGSNDKLIHEKNIIIDSLQTTIERIESERDHYKCEYFKFKELFKKDADKDDNDLWSQVCELRAQISEKEHTISKLTREKRELVNEKFGLKSKIHTLENHQKRNISPTRTCFCDSVTHGEKLSTSSKSKLERVERERDLAKADVERLIQERDSLRERLQIASASQMSEIRRMCTKLTDTEARFEICDRERRELLIAQGGRKAALQGMDEKFDDLKEELKRTKQELTEQRTQYFQLRTLQDQTDHALSDIQGQLAQTESELSTAIERCKSFERQHQQRDNQIKELQQEIMTHKSRMAQIDRDKDQLLIELDEKTEKIAALEREIVFKETQVNSLEQQVRDVSHNKQLCLEQANEMEHHTRSLQLELENLQRQLQSANLERDTTMQEAHRLADDLASISCELRTTRSELEASKAEVQDLKRQLQTYVSEVRRAEELIGQKENERTEMLNHFRSLSLEASALENNNHSLETEAAEARSALQSARDLVTDLERQLSDKDVLVRGYENQIIELTQSVASLEIQVQQSEDQRLHLQDELRTVRTLCVTLEQQKDSLDKKLDEAIERKTELELQLDRYRTEQDIFHDQMNKDHMMIDRLEKLLEESRKETATAQCNQRELQSEITRLKYKISDMQSKLSAETSELRKYQTQASEYGKQISELRRQVTNERYERAKLQDNHSSNNGREADYQNLQTRSTTNDAKCRTNSACNCEPSEPIMRCASQNTDRCRSSCNNKRNDGKLVKIRLTELSDDTGRLRSKTFVPRKYCNDLMQQSTCCCCSCTSALEKVDNSSVKTRNDLSPRWIIETLDLLNKVILKRKRARLKKCSSISIVENQDKIVQTSVKYCPKGRKPQSRESNCSISMQTYMNDATQNDFDMSKPHLLTVLNEIQFYAERIKGYFERMNDNCNKDVLEECNRSKIRMRENSSNNSMDNSLTVTIEKVKPVLSKKRNISSRQKTNKRSTSTPRSSQVNYEANFNLSNRNLKKEKVMGFDKNVPCYENSDSDSTDYLQLPGRLKSINSLSFEDLPVVNSSELEKIQEKIELLRRDLAMDYADSFEESDY